MNTPDELELLRRLRALPREREPQRDLWAGIRARIAAAPAPRRRYGAWIGLAAAASLAAAIGLNWRATPPPAPATRSAAPTIASETIRREADALTLEYQLALEPYAAASLPSPLQAAATELDASARQLRVALREQPDAAYLLDRLRNTYDQRLKLVQRALG